MTKKKKVEVFQIGGAALLEVCHQGLALRLWKPCHLGSLSAQGSGCRSCLLHQCQHVPCHDNGLNLWCRKQAPDQMLSFMKSAYSRCLFTTVEYRVRQWSLRNIHTHWRLTTRLPEGSVCSKQLEWWFVTGNENEANSIDFRAICREINVILKLISKKQNKTKKPSLLACCTNKMATRS